MSSINILPSNLLRILEPDNYATFGLAYRIILPYFAIFALLGVLIGLIIGKVKGR